MSATVAHHHGTTHKSAGPSKLGKIVAGVFVTLAVLSPAVHFYIRNEIRFEDVPKQGTVLMEGASSVVGDDAAVTLKRLSADEIGSYKITTVFATPGPNGFRKGFEGTQTFRMISTDSQEGLRVGMTLNETKGFDREGNEIPRGPAQRNPFENVEFVVSLNSQGGMLPTEGPKDVNIPGEAVMNQLLVAAMEPNKFSTSGTVKKGDTWQRNLTGSITGNPDSHYLIKQDIRYEGAALLDGARFARCSMNSYSEISNMVTNTEENFKYTSENLLVNRTVRATGDIYIDPDTGRVHHVILQGRLTSENRQRLIMKDRPEPVDQQPNKNSFPFRNEFHVEYL